MQNASVPPGLNITSATSGVGPGTVTYSIAPSSTPFSASIRIAHQSATVSQEIPRLWIDTPRDATVTSPFVIAGWTLAQSVDAASSGIDVVHAWAFPADGGTPRFLGSATMDGSRPDVASAFGPGYGRSGFSLTTPWLRPGRYQISVYGRSRTGQFDAFAATTITAVGESRAMALDFPSSSTGLVVQPGTSIFVAGWALDRAAASGNGADIIHAWAFPVGPGEPVFLGSATAGHPRPDVGAFFGARFTPSGFSALLTAPRPGVYDLAVYARSTATGLFDQWQVVRITVLPPQ